ncbi:hypothetical protein [Streptomyces sp. NPDC048508]|uniref:hypothetical protein n=1 Tax=Streptomyces sp. NPDC048508 TaxID=3365561 RepID=UPI00371E41BF
MAADSKTCGVEQVLPVLGPVGDGFDRERLVVSAVERDLPGGTVVGAQSIGEQRDAADPGAREAGVVAEGVGGAARSTVCWVASGRVRLRRVELASA